MLHTHCHCYLINLDRSPERLVNMHAHLSALGVQYQRVSGVDGMALDDAAFQQLTANNRYYKPLTRGEVGCYLSHNKALHCFLDSGAGYALILEDDVILDSGFCTLINTAITCRDKPQPARLQWDILKLTQRRRRARYMQLAALGTRHLVEYGLSVPIVAAASVWTRAGAERWLRAFHGCARPIDCDLQHPWEYGLSILSVHPSPATQSDDTSTIGSRKRKPLRNPLPKLRYEAARLWPRLRHFGRRYGWYRLLAWLWNPCQRIKIAE